MFVGHHVTKFILQVNEVNGIPTITFDREHLQRVYLLRVLDQSAVRF